MSFVVDEGPTGERLLDIRFTNFSDVCYRCKCLTVGVSIIAMNGAGTVTTRVRILQV